MAAVEILSDKIDFDSIKLSKDNKLENDDSITFASASAGTYRIVNINATMIPMMRITVREMLVLIVAFLVVMVVASSSIVVPKWLNECFEHLR